MRLYEATAFSLTSDGSEPHKIARHRDELLRAEIAGFAEMTLGYRSRRDRTDGASQLEGLILSRVWIQAPAAEAVM